MSTERCGFWQNGSCGRETCLEVCRPATPSAFRWPPKSCPCGDIMSGECCKSGCKWERDPSLVPVNLRTTPPSDEPVYHLRQYGDVSQAEMDYYEKHGTLDRTQPSGDEALTDERIFELLSEHTTFDRQSDTAGSSVPTVMNQYGHEVASQRFIDFARAIEREVRATKGTPAQPDMPAICAALGFDPTNHHNAAKCPYCSPQRATQPAPVDERAAFEVPIDAIDMLLHKFERAGGPFKVANFGVELGANSWASNVENALAELREYRAALAAPKPGEKT